MGLYNVETPCSGFWFFRERVTTDGDPVHAGTVVIIAMYSVQKRVEVIVKRKFTPMLSQIDSGARTVSKTISFK